MKTGFSYLLRIVIYCNFQNAYKLIHRDRESSRAVFEKFKPDFVVHLAAKVGGLFNNMAHKVEFYNDNIIMNMNVMELCREYKVIFMNSHSLIG